MRLNALLRSVAPPSGPLGIQRSWTETEMRDAFGSPIGRSGRRKAGFWTVRFKVGALTVDTSFVGDGALALVHIEGVEPAPFGEVSEWVAQETSEPTVALQLGSVRMLLVRHADSCAISWRL